MPTTRAAQPTAETVATPATTDAWGNPAPAPAADAWGNTTPAADSWLSGQPSEATTAASAADWLDAPVAVVSGSDAASPWQIQRLWDGSLPIEDSINQGLAWVVLNFRPFFQTVRDPINDTLLWVEALLQSVPALAMVSIFGLLAWQFAGRGVAVTTVISLLVVVMLNIWPEAMVTLSLVLTALAFCLTIGLPLGIFLASNDRAQRIARPFLDAMQTTPAFVYLVPVVMLFGIGNVPGVIVTIIFALPPLVRLTNLGIRQVRPDLIEAARAYGASPAQMLFKVQLPLALPSIMAGVNQTLMLSLSMVVIASMIAVGGLGQMVLRGIGRLDMGLATVGGLGIVLLAISLDRITQAAGQARRGVRHWWQTGPIGLLMALWRRLARPAAASRVPTVAAPALVSPSTPVAQVTPTAVNLSPIQALPAA